MKRNLVGVLVAVIGLVLLLGAAWLVRGSGALGLRAQLFNTRWEIVETEGFDENLVVPGSSIKFGFDRVWYNDGCNSSSDSISWHGDGITVTAGGDTTLVGCDQSSTFAQVTSRGNRTLITVDDDQLTLERDGMTVLAERK